MYGMLEPGGMINLVPKTPDFSNHSELTAKTGSNDTYRGEIDLNRQINDQLALRLAGSYQNSESFRDFVQRESTFFSPSVAWRPAKDVRVTSWLWYQDLVRPVDNGVAFTNMGKPAEDIRVNRAGPYHNTQDIQDIVWGTQLEYDLTPELTLRDRFLVHDFDSKMDAIRVSGATSAANKYTTYLDRSSFHNLEFDNFTEALYHFDLGGTKHELLSGVELSRSDYNYDRLVSQNSPAISIFSPVYWNGPFVLTPGAAQQLTLTQVVAGYVQDQVNALDNRLHLLVGGRADHVDQIYRPWNAANQKYSETDTGFSGRAGLMYDVTPWMSPYVNVCHSFNPNSPNTTGYDGQTLDPTTGQQYEGGFKFSFFDKRLSLTADAFQVTKDNVPVADPNHTGFSLNGGTLRSQGTELDVLGQITDELQVVGNYAYTDTEVLKSSSLPIGARFANIPLQSGSLWLKYTFRDGALKGFGMGSGVFFADSKEGDGANTFELPGYARWDAGIYYSRDLGSGQEMKVQLNVANLLDRTYYESSSSTGSVVPGTPRSIMLQMGLKF
jgi:iron complex outermembrane receptor protein